MESGEVELVGGPLDGRTYIHPASPDDTIRIAMPAAESMRMHWKEDDGSRAVEVLPLAVHVYRRDRALDWRFVYSHEETVM